MELLVILGLVVLVTGGALVASQGAQAAAEKNAAGFNPQSVAEMLDFPAFTFKTSDRGTIRVLAPAGLDPAIVGQALGRWGFAPVPGANASGIVKIGSNLLIPAGSSAAKADLWNVDVFFKDPAATFTPKNEADAIAPEQASSPLSPTQRLVALLAASTSLLGAGTTIPGTSIPGATTSSNVPLTLPFQRVA